MRVSCLILFGWLFDRIDCKPNIIAGGLAAAAETFDVRTLGRGGPSGRDARACVTTFVTADPAAYGSLFDPLQLRAFAQPCGVGRVELAKQATAYQPARGPAGWTTTVRLGEASLPIDARFAESACPAALSAGDPPPADLSIDSPSAPFADARALGAVAALLAVFAISAMTYRLAAARLTELFPTLSANRRLAAPPCRRRLVRRLSAIDLLRSLGGRRKSLRQSLASVVVAGATLLVATALRPETKNDDLFRSRRFSSRR